MDVVYLVERVYFIEDYYKATDVVKAFSTPEGAATWISDTKAAERERREAHERVQKLKADFDAANPFEFTEQPPPNPKKWPSGMRQADITPEMRAERDAARGLLAEYHERYGAAQMARSARRDASVQAAWLAAGESIPLDKVPNHISFEPTEYVTTTMDVDPD